MTENWQFHLWRVARLQKYLGEWVADFDNEAEKRADWNIRHNVMAEKAWLTRVQGIDVDFTINQEFPLSVIFAEWKTLNAEWQQVIENPSVDSVTYQRNDETYTNTIPEIVAHLIDHATYHTGQMNSLLRTAGKTPVDTMYITFLRMKGKI